MQGRNQVRWRPSKKQIWRPHIRIWGQIRIWGLSEPNVLYWRKYLWHCWDFSAPGHCDPLAPPRYAPAPMTSYNQLTMMKVVHLNQAPVPHYKIRPAAGTRRVPLQVAIYSNSLIFVCCRRRTSCRSGTFHHSRCYTAYHIRSLLSSRLQILPYFGNELKGTDTMDVGSVSVLKICC